jgi:hypothetical protein
MVTKPSAFSGTFQLDTKGEGVLTEIGEGIASGFIGIGQGIGELGASVVDLIADTDYASDVTDSANALRDALGIDPEGIAGTTAEILTQFVIPGLGAASAVSKASKLGRLAKIDRTRKARGEGFDKFANMSRAQKLTLGAQQVAAAGLADAAVATDNIRTLGDFFEGGPTTTDQRVGLEGREEAARRLLNKVKIGVEAGGLTAAVPLALKGTGRAAGAGISAVAGTRAAQATGETLQKGGQKIKDYLDALEKKELSEGLGGSGQTFGNVINNIRSVLQYRGHLPQEIADQRGNIAGITGANVRRAETNIKNLEKGMAKYEKGLRKLGHRLTPDKKAEVFDTVFEFLTSPGTNKAASEEILARLPDNLVPIVKQMRGHVRGLSEDVLQSDYLSKLSKENPQVAADIKATIELNLDKYLRRRFEAFERKSFEPSPEMIQVGLSGFKNDKGALTFELNKMYKEAGGDLKKQLDSFLVSDGSKMVLRKTLSDTEITKASELATENFIKTHKIKNVGLRKTNEARVVANKLQTGVFTKRKELKEFQRRILGEIKDPKEAYLGTVADLSEFRAIDQFYGKIRGLSETDNGIGKLFLSPERLAAQADSAGRNLKDFIAERGLRKLEGEGFGSIDGFFVPERIFNDLTQKTFQSSGPIGELGFKTYSGFLRLKGISQFSKTVLSPITQIRNVTTASAFALAQGNVGRGSNLGESLATVYKGYDDVRLGKELQEMSELGVIGTQAELREARELIRTGFGGQKIADEIDGFQVGRGFAQLTEEGTLTAFTKSALDKAEGITRPAQNAYQAGDDIWKIYNFKFEQNKLKNAFSKMKRPEVEKYLQDRGKLAKGADASDEMIERAIKEEAADIVKNTVPNYNLAPELIKSLRKLPVGNFIAFPYEIYRTGLNTITRGIDELASDQAAIREIGLRRLVGASSTFATIPATLSAVAYATSGVSKEEMDAYKRSFAPPWERNARLIPLGRDEKGNISYINFSYSNPYDQLERVVNAAINKTQSGREVGKDTSQIVFESGFEVLREVLQPFTESSIITEKILDVAPRGTGLGRGGRSIEGARVYNEVETAGDKLAKSFAHIADGLLPGFSPVEVRGGKFQAGRFARGVLGGTAVGDALDIAPQNRQGRDYDLAGEIVRSFTGVSESIANLDQSLEYRGYEFGRDRTAASNIFNREANASNATRESVLEAYQKADDARYRIYNNFYQVIEDLRTMGKSDVDIYKTLKQARVGDFEMLMNNMYNPLNVSDQTIDNMQRKGTLGVLPIAEITSLRSQRIGMPFKASEPLEEIEFDIEPIENLEIGSSRQALSSPSAPKVAPQPDAIRPQSQQIPAQIPQIAPLTSSTRFFLPSATGGIFGRDKGVEYQSIVQTAQSRGMTPDELIQKAGLQRADVSASLLPDPRDRDLARRT